MGIGVVSKHFDKVFVTSPIEFASTVVGIEDVSVGVVCSVVLLPERQVFFRYQVSRMPIIDVGLFTGEGFLQSVQTGMMMPLTTLATVS